MEFLVAIGSSIVGKFCEYAVDPIGRQFGYLFYYKSNINNLKEQVQHLKDAKQDLQHSVDVAKRRGEEIKQSVNSWLSEAESIYKMVESFISDEGQANTGCSIKTFPNLVLRHRLSRKAKKMAQSVVEIEEAARKFDKISDVPILQNIFETKDYTVFDTRNSILKGIMEALGNKDVRMIGVYGMAGVGKTTLAKEVVKRALDAKLFNDAVEVAVSANPKVEKIQQDIAERLGLKFHEDGVNARAVRLRHRLRQEEKFLIILDDVWKKLDLLNLGICFEDDQKGCKILLTSRYQGVLEDHMDVDPGNNFKVELLSESEAWTWFLKIVGANLLSGENSNDFKHLGTQIVKECACLPLAIITVAHALKSKGIHFWKDALRRLRRSSMDENVYSSVKLSYDFLENGEARWILLFCSLYEEDAEISIDNLLNLCIGWDLFKDVYTLEESRNRLQTLLDELKSRCLLLKGNYGDDSVKMHDVVRDVGISIAASEDFKMYNIRNNDELKKYLDDNNKLKDSIAISLDANYEDEYCLPSRLNSPELLLLRMKTKGSSLPDNFFEETKKLRVLALSSLRLETLPSSFCNLENLRALHLVGSETEDIHLIGELKKLKVLDLGGSEVKQLPEQIGQLTRLCKLDLSKCYALEVVPPNVISRLVNLEELNMLDSFENWKAEGEVDNENTSSNASLSEVKNLTKLTALYLEIPHVNMLPKDLFSTKLERHFISLGGGGGMDFSSRGLDLNLELFDVASSLLKERGFQMLLKRSENLQINRFNGLKNIVCELDKEAGLSHLKALKIDDNDEIQYIIDYSSMEPNHISDHSVLPTLETFYFNKVKNLEEICHGEVRGAKSLAKLRQIRVYSCDRLKNLLPFFIANRLERIEVYFCPGMKEIVTFERVQDVINSEAVDRIFEFPNLKFLKLYDLPQLASFCPGCDTSGTPDQVPTLFNQKVALPSLEVLELYNLEFNRMWADQLPQTCYLKNLRELSVQWCNNLKYLLSSAFARNLVQLEELNMIACRGMEEIIVIKEPTVTFDNSDESDIIKFPKLKEIRLDAVAGLIQFCSQSQVQGREQLLFADSAYTLFNQKVAFPSLENLVLMELNAIKRIWPNQLPETSKLNNLQDLYVESCEGLKYVLPFAIAESLVQLKNLVVRKCVAVEEIIMIEEPKEVEKIDKKLLPKLKCLKLSDLPNLARFCSIETNIICGPNFIPEVHIRNCVKPWRTSAEKKEDKDMNLQEKISMQSPCDEKSQGEGSEQLLFADSAYTLFNRKVAFPSLEKLVLEKLHSIERIWPNQRLETSKLYNLEDLSVESCKGLKYVLPFTIAESLVQLEKLSVRKCEELEEIIMIKKPKQEVEKTDKKLLPKLKSLELFDLPNFARFCSIETNIICGLNFKPEVHIRNCLRLWSISAEKKEDKNMNLQEKISLRSPRDEKQVEYFSAGLDMSTLNSVQKIPYDPLVPNLTTKLVVHQCHEIENLLSASMAKSFVHLRTLGVSDCELLKNIVVTEESGDGIRSQMICFPALKILELSELPNLEKFCAGDHIECPFLEALNIEDCPKLNTFISNSTDKAVPEETDMNSGARQPLFGNQKVTLPKLRILMLEKCNSVTQIWDIDDTKERGQQSAAAAGRSRSAVFQSLEFLRVSKCGRLNKLLEANSSSSFENLTVLEVLECKRMEYLFTPSAAKTLVLLKKMGISKCQAMTEIIASSPEVDHDNKLLSFDNLELLVLQSLPSLTSFHMGNCNLEFPKLSRVVVVGSCPELRSFCGHGTITTPKLRTFVRRRRWNHLYTWYGEDADGQITVSNNWFASYPGDDQEDDIEEGGNIDINTTIQQFHADYEDIEEDSGEDIEEDSGEDTE